MRRTITALTTATVIAAGGVAGAFATTAQAAPAPSQAATAGWTVVTPGPAQPRTAIPWKSVGTGWSAQTAVQGHAGTLYLVSPEGRRYTVATVSERELAHEISGDGRSVILRDYGTGRARVVETATGRAHRQLADVIPTFSRPSGKVLITISVADGSRHYTGIQQRDFDGRVQKQSGKLSFDSMLSSRDGRTWAVNTNDGVNVMDPATMRLGRRYAVPAGFRACSAIDTWDATSFVESCWRPANDSQLFVQKFAGGTPVQQTWGRGQNASGSYDGILQTSLGSVALAPRRAQGEWEVETPYLVRGRATTPIALPGKYAVDHSVVDAVGSGLFVEGLRHDPRPTDMARIDVAAKRIVPFGNVLGMAVLDRR